MPIVPVLTRLGQKNRKFKTSLEYIVKTYLERKGREGNREGGWQAKEKKTCNKCLLRVQLPCPQPVQPFTNDFVSQRLIFPIEENISTHVPAL